MKRNQMGKRFLALTLSAVMVMNCGISVFAEETQQETEIVVSIPEPETTVTTTEETSVDEDGNNTLKTITITEGKDESSAYYEEETLSITKDAEGNLVEESGVVEGNQSFETDVEVDVTIKFDEIKEGETASGSSEGKETVFGDLKEDETDTKYDQTTITETPKEVEGTLGKVEVVTGNGDVEVGEDTEIGLDSVNHEWTESDERVGSHLNKPEYTATMEQLKDEEYLKNLLAAKPDGYDYLYIGVGEGSYFGADWKYNPDTSYYGYGTTTNQYVMIDFSRTSEKEALDIITAYCCDIETTSKKGYWYEVSNLEDSYYYESQETADHIRAIALNGYWGTESGKGSLDEFKKFLGAAKDENGVEIFSEADLNSLSEGMALAATQAAIWEYGNHSEEEYIDFKISTLDYKDRFDWHFETLKNELMAQGHTSDEANELVRQYKNLADRVKNYLVGLSMTAEEAGTTEIMNEERFIESMGMTIGNKAADVDANKDDDDTNDVYNVDVTFALVVSVTDDDDYIVKVIDADGNVAATGRIAGKNAQGQEYEYLTADANGNYTIKGLTLAENSNAKFSLTLEGAQYLKQGVYLYTSEQRDTTRSQTFVGIAEGYQAVDLSANVEFNFNVEDGVKTISRVWSDGWYEYNEQETETETSVNEEPETETETETETESETRKPHYGNDDPTGGDFVEIEDEEVPLADAPETGSIAAACLMVAAVSGLGLTTLALKGRRDKEDEK